MTKKKNVKEVEQNVLNTFKKEIPSIHFSDKQERDYQLWIAKQPYIFRDLLHFPPKMFDGCSLIDFGAGTGENTIQFANWGAKRTLVDVNDKACNIARKVFKTYAENTKNHRIICESIFDYKCDEKYDIVVSSGVIHHTGDKENAFSRISSFIKPDGYIILGIGNKVGGFQNMLQRMIIYNFARTDEDIVEIAEKLFKEDIDRSQKVGKRTRRAIIFDRFVVPKQDDPTISEVLQWFCDNNLNFYSSYPPILPPVLSDLQQERVFRPQDFLDVGAFTEAFWMIHRDDDVKEVPKILKSFTKLSKTQFDLTDYVNDFNLDTTFKKDLMSDYVEKYRQALNEVDLLSYLKKGHKCLFDELYEVIDLLREPDFENLSKYLKKTKYLFRGANGLRQMYFIAYKN